MHDDWYAAIFRAVPDGFWTLDGEGRLCEVNDAYCRMTGYSREDLLGIRVSDLEACESPQETAAHLRAIREAGGDRFETRHRCKDGRLIDVEVSAACAGADGAGGDGGRFFAFLRDVTEKKHAAKESELAAAFLSENPNPVLRIAADGSMPYANAAARGVLSREGCPAGDEPPAEWLRWNAEILEGGFPRTIQVEFAGKIFSFVVVPFCPAGYANWYGRDVTGWRRAEAEAREAQSALLDQQRRETDRVEAELERVRGELIRTTRLAAIGQVSASIAHDLRNPLGSVRNAAFYLKRHLPAERPHLNEFIEIIEDQVNDAERIISGLLEMTQARAACKRATDLRGLVEDAFGRVRNADGVRCRVRTVPDPFRFQADPDQFRQVLVNLIQNAVQAMNGRGELLVDATREGDRDVILVRDTGPGVADGVKETLFEPLVTTKAKGTGLGLMICRQIVERHGGVIELIAEETPGAAFRISLPCGGQPRESR